MLDWLALGWDLAIVVSGSFFVSLSFRGWPLKFNPRTAALHTLMAAATMTLLLLTPSDIVALPGVGGIPPDFADLRYVPLAVLTLVYGPLWALLGSLLTLLPRLALGAGPLELLRGAGVSMLYVLTVSALVRPQLNLLRPSGKGAGWRLLLIFAGVGLPYTLAPALLARGAAPLWPASLLVFANLLGFSLGGLVLRSRFQLLAATARLAQQANTDALTGLWNRRQFEADLAGLLPGQGLLVADLDHFKSINDRFGHDVGDEYLISAAAALSRAALRQGRAYRLGGEEFAVLTDPGDPGRGGRVAVSLLGFTRQISHPSNPGGQLTCSVGLVRRRPDETPQLALRRADLALFQAKAWGRDRIEDAGERVAPAPLAKPAAGRRAASPLLWEAINASLSLAALDTEVNPLDWARLLQAAILSVPGAESGTINVLRSGAFEQVAQTGFDDALIGLTHSAAEQLRWYGLGEAAWRRGQPRALYGAEIAERSDSSAAAQEAQGSRFREHGRVAQLQANLCIPVVLDGEVIAHLNLDRSSDSRHFSDTDLSVARAFADQVTVLLAGTRRREAMQQRQREQEWLAAFGLALLEARSLQDVIDPLLAGMDGLYGCHSQLLVELQGVLHGWQPDDLPGGVEVPAWSGEVVRRFWAAGSAQADSRVAQGVVSSPSSLLLFKLRWPDHSPAALMLWRRTDAPFSAQEQRFLELVSRAASSALTHLAGRQRDTQASSHTHPSPYEVT